MNLIQLNTDDVLGYMFIILFAGILVGFIARHIKDEYID